MAELGPAPGDEHTKKVCALRSHKVYGRYLITDAKGRLKIDRGKVQAEARLDGTFLLRTSDDTLSPEDIALGDRQLLEVESAFRRLKTVLELRPVYHRLEDRIRSHVLLRRWVMGLTGQVRLSSGAGGYRGPSPASARHRSPVRLSTPA